MQVSLALVADGMRRVTIADRERAQEIGIRLIDGREPASLAYRNAQRPRLVSKARDGRLTVPVAHTMPLSEAAKALTIVREGHPGGKLALML